MDSHPPARRGTNRKDVVMETESEAPVSILARAWITVFFAVLAIAAVVSNARVPG